MIRRSFLFLECVGILAGGPHLRGEYSSQNEHLVFNLRVPHVCLGLANVGTCSENRSLLHKWRVPNL